MTQVGDEDYVVPTDADDAATDRVYDHIRTQLKLLQPTAAQAMSAMVHLVAEIQHDCLRKLDKYSRERVMMDLNAAFNEAFEEIELQNSKKVN